MRASRDLEWEGASTPVTWVGLPAGRGTTRWGALVRADALDGLSADGWAAVWAHGVRTVIDLRNADERGEDRAPRPAGLTTIHLPLDVCDDRELRDVWGSGPQSGTPLYHRPHLERFPQRTAAVVADDVAALRGRLV